MQRLVIDSLTGQDISAAFLASTYTADANRLLLLQLYLTGLAGQGNYRACLTKQLGGIGDAYQSPTSSIALATGVSKAYLPTIVFPVLNTDVIRVYVQGLPADVAVDIVVEVWDVTAATSADVTGVPASLAARVLEGTLTWEQALRIILDAAAAGNTSGMDTATGHIRDLANSKDRITATLDGNGNRTITAVDGT